MKKLVFLLIVLLPISAGAQSSAVSSDDSYEFIQAKLAAADGRFDEALAKLDKLVARNADDPVLQYERAMILIDAGRVDDAEAALRKVAAAKPDFYDAQRMLGRILIDRAGSDRAKVDEALTHLQAAFRIYPDDLATGMAVAQILLTTGRWADSEKVLATMLERAPDQRAINYMYAQVLTKLGRGNESRQYLERAVEVDPTFGQAVLQLVDIYEAENDYPKAAAVLQPLIAEDPMNVELQRRQAYLYLRGGEPEKARAALKTLVDADPKDTRSLFYLAEAYNDLEQYAEADKIYRKLLEVTPDDPDVLASYGLSQSSQHKFDEAKKTFEALQKLPELPDNLQVLAKTQLAWLALQKNDYTTAIDLAKQVLIFRDKPNTQAVNTALEAMKKQKKYADAVALLQPLADKYSSDPFVNARYVEFLLRAGEKDRAKVAAATQMKFGVRNTVGAAEAYVQNEQYDAAIGLLKDAVKTKPDEVDLQFELGSAYERAGNKPDAEKVFQGILEKHPDNTQTLNYLGYMWAESGVNLERAQSMLQKAVAAEPRNGAYIDSLGWVYYQQGKLDLAEKYLMDAARLLPRDATVHQHLGDVVAKRGDVGRALEIYRAALKLEPEAKDEAKLRSKIAELEKQKTQAQR
ncbi:MAG TPA: tetratricopeptide repeat protein [Thermoanaerobaculia bacterium]|nr:tetratricopeptide repeat protein [Thermoanaerobaculia bacterium]